MAEKHLVSFSLVFLAAAVFAGQAHGNDLCSKADYIPLCRSVVKGVSDPKVALKKAMEHLLFETKHAKEASVKLGKSQAMDACKDNYDSAIYDLEESLEYLKSNDKGGLQTNLSGAITFYVTCDDAVAEGGVVKLASGLLKTDTLLSHLASNCLHLSSFLT